MFWVTVPVTVLALALAVWLMEDPPPRPARPLDLPGVGLVSVGLGLFTAGLIEAGDRGWTDTLVGTLLATGVIGLTCYTAWEKRRPWPMVPRELLRRGAFTWGNFVGFGMNFGGVGTLFLLTLFLETEQGHSALETGLLLLPATLPLAVLAPAAVRIGKRYGNRWPMTVGLTSAALSGVLLGFIHRGSQWWVLAPMILLLGIGLALNTGPMVNAVMRSAPPEQASLAAATNNTARQIGSAFGVAVLGSIAGLVGSTGFTRGFHHAALLAAALWAIAALAATRVTPDDVSTDHPY